MAKTFQKKPSFTSKPVSSYQNRNFFHPNANKPPFLPTPSNQSQTKYPQKPYPHVPADVKAEKIAKGLCYFCDQKYDKNHKCNFRGSQIFTVEVEGYDEDESENEVPELEEGADVALISIEPFISFNALTGKQTFQTMRVIGMLGDTKVHILIDSGSTHNFLDIATAKKIRCTFQETEPQAITVADGNHIACQHKYTQFHWRMNKKDFEGEVLLIPLGGCDMVLGI